MILTWFHVILSLLQTHKNCTSDHLKLTQLGFNRNIKNKKKKKKTFFNGEKAQWVFLYYINQTNKVIIIIIIIKYLNIYSFLF